MTALAVLAAVGQAIHAGVIYGAIAGGVLLAAVTVAVACALTPADWEPRTLRKAQQPGPIERFWDEVAALRAPISDDESGNSE